MKVDDLRQEAKEAGVGATSGMKKEELVREVAKAAGQGDGDQAQDAARGSDAGSGLENPGRKDA